MRGRFEAELDGEVLFGRAVDIDVQTIESCQRLLRGPVLGISLPAARLNLIGIATFIRLEKYLS